MSVDYDATGGIGISVTDEVLKAFIAHDIFTEEDLDYHGLEQCLDGFSDDVEAIQGGNAYSGTQYPYLVVPGYTLGEIKANAPAFIAKMAELDVQLKEDELRLVVDYVIS